MRKTIAILICLGLSFVGGDLVLAQNAEEEEEELFRSWVEKIGGDEFGGRRPLTKFEDKTVDYLAGEMERLGLRPAFEGSWVQSVPLLSTTVEIRKGRMVVKGRKGRADLDARDELVVWTSRNAPKVSVRNAEMVFCGFGISAPEFGWDDFEGVDVSGKIVVAMVNDPGFYDASLFRGRNMTYYGRWTYKFEEALRRGAVGCLVLHNEAAASYGFSVLSNGHSGMNQCLYDAEAPTLAFNGWISEDACRKVFEVAGRSFEAAVAEAGRPGFRAIPLGVKASLSMDVSCEVSESHNVAGILPGTDLAEEAVVFSAHWDHFGIGEPDENGDCIFNGAADNASGIAAVFLLAHKFVSSSSAPRRSLVFLCPTSEEGGLFGSEWYCDHPAVPLEKTVTCFNFDCVAPAEWSPSLIVLRNEPTFLDEWLETSALKQGRKIDFSDDNSDGWFYRSDHWNFVKRGVKCVALGTTPKAGWYHKQNDEYSPSWDVSGSLANISLIYSASSLAASSPFPYSRKKNKSQIKKSSIFAPLIADYLFSIQK